MKVIHLNTSINGGAGKAVARLHTSLISLGIKSGLLSLEPELQHQLITHSTAYLSSLGNKDLFLTELRELFFKVFKSFQKSSVSINSTYFTFLNSSYKNLPALNLIKEADLIHFHWISNFVDLPSFSQKSSQPIVWTLHDFNPFSPGYHYKPTEKELVANKQKLEELEKKKISILKKKKIHFVYTSKYMGKLLKASKIGRHFPSSYIPLGLDHTVFARRDSSFAKSLLGVPKDKKVILIVGDDLKAIRKGISYIRDSIEHIQYPTKDLVLCVLGKCDLAGFPKDFPIIHLGFIQDERLMSLAYATANVFITTATQEAFGQTTIEALCCGKPVIGFPVGVIPEAIIEEKNGFICKEKTPKSVAALIDRALQKEWDEEWISKDAANRYNLQLQAKAYQDLYTNILKQ